MSTDTSALDREQLDEVRELFARIDADPELRRAVLGQARASGVLEKARTQVNTRRAPMLDGNGNPFDPKRAAQARLRETETVARLNREAAKQAPFRVPEGWTVVGEESLVSRLAREEHEARADASAGRGDR